LVLQPELYSSWHGGYESVTFKPYWRLDQNDPERTHFDLRELFWEKAERLWELRVGIRRVFWGVTESRHLVDIINQTDLVENPDGEEKLGQPMVNASLILRWGTIDLFALPGFRERTFPGAKGRLRIGPVIDVKNPLYESHHKERRIDWAARWTNTLGDWDLGLSHFTGTSRDPGVTPVTKGTEIFFRPVYGVIDQTSIDVQATKGGWLLKGELISRGGQGDRFTALDAGFEYTLGNIQSSGIDIGLLTEYLYDDRARNAPGPFEDDIFLGVRLAFNDVQSTEMLAGVIRDRDTKDSFWQLEASRRLGDRMKLTVEGQIFGELSAQSPLYDLRRDDYLQADVSLFF